MRITRRHVLQAAFLAALSIGCVAAPFAASAQDVTTPTTAAPTTTAAPPTTAAPTTEAPPATEAPATTTAPPASTTTRPRPTTTTIPRSTTTPEQLPTLPPLPAGQVPAPTETTVVTVPSGGTAKVSPLFPALSIGGFTVALLVLVVSFLLNSRRTA